MRDVVDEDRGVSRNVGGGGRIGRVSQSAGARDRRDHLRRFWLPSPALSSSPPFSLCPPVVPRPPPAGSLALPSRDCLVDAHRAPAAERGERAAFPCPQSPPRSARASDAARRPARGRGRSAGHADVRMGAMDLASRGPGRRELAATDSGRRRRRRSSRDKFRYMHGLTASSVHSFSGAGRKGGAAVFLCVLVMGK